MELLAHCTPLFVAAVVVALLILLQRLFVPCHLHQEPPLFHSRIPYIGHILGLYIHGSRYYEWTSAQCRLPIYTLQVLNSKIYVVTAPELVNAVYRNSKTLAFNPFIAQVSKRISGHDEATAKIIQHNLNGEGHGYVPDMHDGIVSALAPGPKLAYMVKPLLQALSIYLQDLTRTSEVELFTWTRRLTTLCTTSAFYGPSNPFAQNHEYCDLFWDIQNDLDKLMMDIFLRVFAPRGFQARSTLGDAFKRYFENYNHNDWSSAVTEVHRALNCRYGLFTWNQGRLQLVALLKLSPIIYLPFFICLFRSI